MDKTRKAFVVLAAAVTAGNAGGCGSNTTSPEDAKLDDAPAIDSKVSADAAPAAPDTKREDVAADAVQSDVGMADASRLDANGADASVSDVADLAPGDVLAVDAGAGDARKLDGAIDALGADVLLRMDASVAPDAPGPLVMPAGTAYDVLTRQDLA